MIIDFHTHIFPEKIAARTIEKLENIADVRAFTDGRDASLIASMEAAGVDLSIVLPVVTRPEQFNTVNEFAARLNEKYQESPYRLLSFGGVHPNTLNYKRELRIIRDLGLQGIKLHPDYQDTYFDDIKYMRILDYATELGLISVVHAGVDIGFPDHVRCSTERIRTVIDTVAPERMVLAHYGGFGLWDEVAEWIAGENVYLDTAYIFGFIEDATFHQILKKHGADKILFATDSPWSGQKESLDYLQSLALDPKDQKQILGQNAEKLLQLSLTGEN